MASLDVPEEYFRDMNQEYCKRRNFLLDGLNKIPGVYSPMPRGAFYTVARPPADRRLRQILQVAPGGLQL